MTTMTNNDTTSWTARQVDSTYQRIHELQMGYHLVVSADAVQQYDLLLGGLRGAGMRIAPWHDLEPDAAGTVSGYQLRDSLDVLTKLVEDETDTRMPTGAPIYSELRNS